MASKNSLQVYFSFVLFFICLMSFPQQSIESPNNEANNNINTLSRDEIGEKLIGPLNQIKISVDSTKEGYFFLVAGHLYGNYDHKKSVFPSSTLLANLNKINNMGAAFFVALGDNFRLFQEPYVSCYKYAWTTQLKIPLFNAVGNHDVDFGRDKYSYHFGPTYYSFVLGPALFIILDTGKQNSPLMSEEQLEFVDTEIKKAKKDKAIKNVFIFTHKLIWAENGNEYFKHVNRLTNIPNNNNYFQEKIYPQLKKLAEKKGVFIGSGDIGYHSPPIFYHYNYLDKITYFATGLNDCIDDAMLKVSVGKEGEVKFEPISLTDQELMDIEEYGIGFWRWK